MDFVVARLDGLKGPAIVESDLSLDLFVFLRRKTGRRVRGPRPTDQTFINSLEASWRNSYTVQ